MNLLHNIKISANAISRMVVVLVLIVAGCTPKKYDTDFKIYNISSTDITLKYYFIDTGDTNSLVVNPSNTEVIYSIPYEAYNHNWYYDYKISINSITNTAGDSVKFNPNENIRWDRDVNNSYRLLIYDSSF